MKYLWLPLLLVFVLTLPQALQAQTNATDSKIKGIASAQSIHPDNPYYSHTATNNLFDVPKSVWKSILPDHVYHIAFEGGTERPFSGKYWNFEGKGTYYCGVCGNKLFRSTAKFASMCGWPSFFKPAEESAVIYKPDHSHGLNRTEVICARCGAHLGHVFKDGPEPTGLRYCMNSAVLDFVPDEQV